MATEIKHGTIVFVCTSEAKGQSDNNVRGFGTVSYFWEGDRATVDMTGELGGWIQVGDLVLYEEEIEDVASFDIPIEDIRPVNDMEELPDVDDENCPLHPASA